jgi:hypothetical protein
MSAVPILTECNLLVEFHNLKGFFIFKKISKKTEVTCKGTQQKDLDHGTWPIFVWKIKGNLMPENSQDYAQKPKRNCTFMNSASGNYFLDLDISLTVSTAWDSTEALSHKY